MENKNEKQVHWFRDYFCSNQHIDLACTLIFADLQLGSFGQNNELLAAITSLDEQWCFPLEELLPQPLSAAIKTYEDAILDWHMRINPISVVKSIILNRRKVKWSEVHPL